MPTPDDRASDGAVALAGGPAGPGALRPLLDRVLDALVAGAAAREAWCRRARAGDFAGVHTQLYHAGTRTTIFELL